MLHKPADYYWTPPSDAVPAAADVPVRYREADHGRRFLEGIVSFVAVAGMVLLVPFVILIAGLPVVLLVRGAAEVVGWLVGRLLT